MSRRDSVDAWRRDLRSALVAAMKQRDTVATAALRSALGAIDNAEAIDARIEPDGRPSEIAGGVAGVGATEAARKRLTAAHVEALVRREVVDRRAAAAEYDALGRGDEAAVLVAQADLLHSFL